jgi:hypothetical protein
LRLKIGVLSLLPGSVTSGPGTESKVTQNRKQVLKNADQTKPMIVLKMLDTASAFT